MMIGERIAAEALTWCGTPGVAQGRLKGVGCDCKGLLAGVAKACGRPEGDSLQALAADYGPLIPVRRLRQGLADLFDPVQGVQPGDILLLKMGGKAQHLAIAINEREMVHCYPGKHVLRAWIAAGRRLDSVWRWR